MRPKLELINVTQTFQSSVGESHTTALASVSLHIHTGEIVALVGPSGCGKSTILNLIAGFMQPSSGQILLDGKPLAAVGPERLVVFQTPALFPWLNVMDNVNFGPRMRGERSSSYQRLEQEVIGQVGLSGFEKHFPYQLSGGMRQRVQIARALINRPQVLLLDEPFGALDAQTRLEMQVLLLRVWEQHQATILFITHDVDEALFLSDRTYVLSARPGRIQQEVLVPFGKPRRYEILGTEEFGRMKTEILNCLHKSHATPTQEGFSPGEVLSQLETSR